MATLTTTDPAPPADANRDADRTTGSASDHRRLVRALWAACVLAGAWLASHDVGRDSPFAPTSVAEFDSRP